ncbi:hypothetical protein MOPEL_067_00660 [Mobilicoccus pelagius NBRC 104925]|uniref:Uncharacterized protein n=1 Tax=Mobilicoccus pelagius NBRC 104925 TaxID=1089455 RepID=H5UR59_9MICO|nr:hypothetical protein MOPEL_067_00660 [Mobilicoccus pelagius NBRC 104925]
MDRPVGTPRGGGRTPLVPADGDDLEAAHPDDRRAEDGPGGDVTARDRVGDAMPLEVGGVREGDEHLLTVDRVALGDGRRGTAEAAVRERHVAAALDDRDARVLVETTQSGGRGHSGGDAADHDDVHGRLIPGGVSVRQARRARSAHPEAPIPDTPPPSDTRPRGHPGRLAS